MSAVIAPPAVLTFSPSDVLCAPVFLLSPAPFVPALSQCPSTAPATEKASACPVAIPPVLGKLATGDCDWTPARFAYVPKALPVTLCAAADPARRVSPPTRIAQAPRIFFAIGRFSSRAQKLPVRRCC